MLLMQVRRFQHKHVSVALPPHELLSLLLLSPHFFYFLLHFLFYIPLLRRRRGIVLRDNYGPIDMCRGDLVQGEGGGGALMA